MDRREGRRTSVQSFKQDRLALLGHVLMPHSLSPNYRHMAPLRIQELLIGQVLNLLGNSLLNSHLLFSYLLSS